MMGFTFHFVWRS